MITRYWSLAGAVAFAVLLPAAAFAQQTRGVPGERGRTPASLGIRGFSVVLVVGNAQTTGASETVPEAARKALADMKDFLPYKRYQLLDAAWIVCCGPSTTPISGRVRGPDGRDFQYSIDTLGVADDKLNLRFAMKDLPELTPLPAQGQISDTARGEQSRQLYEAMKDSADAEILYRSVKRKHEVGAASDTEMETATARMNLATQRVEQLRRSASSAAAGARGSGGSANGGARASSSPRSMIDSTFSIALGETVVIGTSRLNGDQALIAILTAAPKPGAVK